MSAATPSTVLRIDGRDVTISNPDKVLFPDAKHTKLDVVQYYLAVAEGALRGAGGRPNVLVRYPNGIGADFFYQKRAPESRPEWVDVVSLRFPSGRSADEVLLKDAATLAWMANLACLELHPHPVRAVDLDHPDELRVDLDPVPGVPWSQVRDVAGVVKSVLDDFGLVGWPKTSGSRGMHVNLRLERKWGFDDVRRAALALSREVERRAPTIATSKWWKEERHGVFLDYNQNAKDRTVAAAYSVRPTPDARVSTPLTWEEVPDVQPTDFTLVTMPARFAAIGDRHAGIDAHPCSLDALLELSERQEKEGQGDAPWPPHYKKQAGEPPRVQPSKRRTPEKAAAKKAAAKKKTAARKKPVAKKAAAKKKSSTGRRVSKHPLVEIGRAQKESDALEGLERWKARHADAASHLEPADVLVDRMRGRFTTWTRIRVNLQHVPEKLRPPQEPLDPDDAPDFSGWAPS